MSNQFRELCARLGIQGLRSHDLSHTCGTRLAELVYGVTTISNSKVLGYSSLTMSIGYIHPEYSIKKAVEDLAKFESFTTNINTTEKLESPS